MRSREVVATALIVGTIAMVALFNLHSLPGQMTFLDQPTTEMEKAFNAFIAKHHKSYGTKEEYNYRLKIFSENYSKIMHHNMMNSQDEGYHMVVNIFSDLSNDEFRMRMGYRRDLKQASNDEPVLLNTDENASSIDWREKNAVTSVKD